MLTLPLTQFSCHARQSFFFNLSATYIFSLSNFDTFVRWTYQLSLTPTAGPTTCPTTWAALSTRSPSLGSVVSLPREIVCPCNISYRVELSLGSVDVGGAQLGAHGLEAAVLARNLFPQPVGDI